MLYHFLCRQTMFLKLNYQCVLAELSPVISAALSILKLTSEQYPSGYLKLCESRRDAYLHCVMLSMKLLVAIAINVYEMISTARTNGSKEPFVTLVV